MSAEAVAWTITGGRIFTAPAAEQLWSEACRYASEIKLRAQLKLAEIYQGGEKASGRAGMGRPSLGGTDSVPPKNQIPTLKDLGIDRHVSSEGKQLLALPKEMQDKVVAGTVSVIPPVRHRRQ